MPESDKSKSQKDEHVLRQVDPEIEARVDKMMSSANKPKQPQTTGSQTSSTAPLLPGEKLPDFEKKPAMAKTQAEPSPEPAENKPPESAPAPPAETKAKRTGRRQTIDDPKTDKAVEEIVRSESDRMMAMEDAKAQLLAEGSAEVDRGFFSRLKSGLGRFFKSPKAWLGIFSVFFLIATTIGAFPSSRYFVLNLLGVRAATSLRIVDNKTQQPLKDAQVSLDDKTAISDKSGIVRLEEIRLGPQQLSVTKPAFADYSEEITVGWGSNPLGDVGLKAVGSRYSFVVKDYVSNKPIKGAEAVSGDASATADARGEIILVVADQEKSKVNIEIKADNYRSKQLKLDVGNKEKREIILVPSQKHAFVSKRSGNYDLYKIDVDGKNEQKILAGTGAETEETTVILPHPNSNLIAYVSTRGEERSPDGSALSGLMVINLDDNEIDRVDYSERFQLLGFIDSKLVYVKIARGEDEESPNRHRIISYDTETAEEKELARSNYFNDVLAVGGAVYYAPSEYKSKGKVGLFKVDADGNNKTKIHGKEAWSILRVAYDLVDVSVGQGQDWYEYSVSSSEFSPLADPPSAQESRIYTTSPDGKRSAWMDNRDGKGVLLVYDIASNKDSIVQSQSGLKNPISWLDDEHLIYRVNTSAETADYVVSLSGGKPKKIKDVTNTAGLDRWYYY